MGEIADRFEMSAPATSQHLKALCAARLVRGHVEGTVPDLRTWQGSVDEMANWVDELKRLSAQVQCVGSGTGRADEVELGALRRCFLPSAVRAM